MQGEAEEFGGDEICLRAGDHLSTSFQCKELKVSARMFAHCDHASFLYFLFAKILDEKTCRNHQIEHQCLANAQYLCLERALETS